MRNWWKEVVGREGNKGSGWRSVLELGEMKLGGVQDQSQ